MTAHKLAVAAIALGLGFVMAPVAHAAITTFIDETQTANVLQDQRAAFNAAAGFATTTDNFSAYAQQNIAVGQTLGSFKYTFDPTQTQPVIGPNGTFAQPNGLGGPFGVFVGSDSVTLTFTGAQKLRAFGMEISAAPDDTDPRPDNIYNLAVIDAGGATVGNVNLGGGSVNFFLGFIADASSPFAEITLSLAADTDTHLVPGIQVNELDFGTGSAGGAVPEPASLTLLLSGLGLAGAFARRRANR